jgi:hypothetical protein
MGPYRAVVSKYEPQLQAHLGGQSSDRASRRSVSHYIISPPIYLLFDFQRQPQNVKPMFNYRND